MPQSRGRIKKPKKSEEESIYPATFRTGGGLLVLIGSPYIEFIPFWLQLVVAGFGATLLLHGALQFKYTKQYGRIFAPAAAFIWGSVLTFSAVSFLSVSTMQSKAQPDISPDDPNGGFNIAGVGFLHEMAAKPVKAKMIVRFRNPKSKSIRYRFENASVTLNGTPHPLLSYLVEEILSPIGANSWIPAEFVIDEKLDGQLAQITVQYSVIYGFDGGPMEYRQRLSQICPTRFSLKGEFYLNECTRTEMTNEKISQP